MVKGIGASGKTVLAWLLAIERAEKRLPSYYLDIASDPTLAQNEPSAVISDLIRFGHSDVLFVLDNIHLEDAFTKEVFAGWEEIAPSDRPQLFLIGWETRSGSGSPIESLKITPLVLRARQAELRGVYQRLALRQSLDQRVLDPTKAVLNDWLQTFGGDPDEPETTADLVAFSSAVQRRLPYLSDGDWTLKHEDAISQVQEQYLDRLSNKETENLWRLCVAAELELEITTSGLVHKKAGLKLCNTDLGIVFRHEVGAKS